MPPTVRSIIYWTRPTTKREMGDLANQHSMSESAFLETLVLAWRDPFHFSRMIRWLYPEGHPAFQHVDGADTIWRLQRENEELKAALSAAKHEQAAAEERARSSEAEAAEA